MSTDLPTADDVLQFWFGVPGADTEARAAWFRKDAQFDAEIAQRFGPLVFAALRTGLAGWDASLRGRLALLIVYDQFPRNLFRGTRVAFAGDAHALALARHMIDAGDDLLLPPVQRWFVYLPLEHAEDLDAQEESVNLFEALAAADAGMADALDYARRHRDVVRRFGRFPHRNEALGRASSAEEIEFLREPGSRF